jgi:hypothetical protein
MATSAKLAPTEANEQEFIFAWAKMQESRDSRLALLHASMNGILTDARFGAKLKRLGRKAGVPDMFLPVPRYADPNIGGHPAYYGLWIELKRKTGGVVSTEQKWWHQQLSECGYRVVVARGASEAIKIIMEYLSE